MVAAWQKLGASVHGAAHQQHGMPNEDAIAWGSFGAGAESGLILAVADGHGSATSFRSAVGAKLAVETALAAMPGLLADLDPGGASRPVATPADELRRRIGTEILSLWHARVDADRAGSPFTADELATLDNDGGRGRERIERNPSIAYGSTLIAAAVSAQRVVLLQLGDGDVMAVSARGTVSRPVPSDVRLIANETTSLCTSEPADFRLQVLSPGEVETLMLATDGYSNSFATDDDFAQVASELQAMLREHGADWVAERVPGWLEQATREGSGDDITVGIVWRPTDDAAAGLDETTDTAPAAIAVAEPDLGPVHHRRGTARRKLLGASLLMFVVLIGLAAVIGYLLFLRG